MPKLPRVVIFQPSLPAYRLDFFERVSHRLGGGLKVFYSPSDRGVLNNRASDPAWAVRLPRTRQFFPGLEWQPGMLSMSPKRGDILVVSGNPRNISSMLVLLWSRLRGINTIWWGHYWSSTSKRHRFLLRILLMKLANAVLFYTDQEVAEYRKGHGRRDRRVVTALNNGVNVDPIRLLRAPYDAALRDNALLFIGRLTEKAELPVLLNALADPRLQQVRLNIIGDGPQRGSLERLARELGVNQRVVWHGGTTDEPTIARIANSCRLFVYPGAVGLSLLHGMAYGLPAVVHDDRWGHMPEIAAFYSANNGLSFARGNPEALATAIADALKLISSNNFWSYASIKVADTEFNTEQMANRFYDLLSSLTS